MPVNPRFADILSADAETRQGLFATTAQRLGTSERNVEKDFWVCLTLDILFNGMPPGPRLLFKGGTSLSKAHGLIDRFSEDIDVTVFRDDIGQPGTVEELAALGSGKRKTRLDEIRAACADHVQGALRDGLAAEFGRFAAETGHAPVEVAADPDDASGQGLLVRYRSITPETGDGYVKPVVRIESGAKSALDPNAPQRVTPYVAADLRDGQDLSVPNVLTVDARRTFWDKVVILHGLRRWFEIRGQLRQEGQRISRHYYDLHRLLATDVANAAGDLELGADCVRHARMFFNRPDYDLATAMPGSFALAPRDGMRDRLRKDYEAMSGMIFGTPPGFDAILEDVAALEATLNRLAGPRPA